MKAPEPAGAPRLKGTAALIATAFYSGYSPFAPGTAGSALALPLAAALCVAGPAIHAAALAVVTLAAVPAAGVVASRLGRHDPACVVIDEVAGMILTLLFVPFSWFAVVAGFLLFRAMDIVKPFPGRRLERLPGGWGIVADDLMAGIYANLVLRALIWTWM